MKGQSFLLRNKYRYALQTGNGPMLVKCLEQGADINRPVFPVGVMDIFLTRRYKKGIDAVLQNSSWNPNYIDKADGLSLIERAMMISEDWAMKIAAHPNFDSKARLGGGRTLAMAAVMFSSPRVFKAFKDETLPTDKDKSGSTLGDYLKTFGHPRRGRFSVLQKNQDAYRRKVAEEAQRTRCN